MVLGKRGLMLLLAAGLLAMPGVALGQGSTAFLGVSVVRVDGKPRVLPDQTVVVRAGRIVAVGPAARAKLPAGVIRVDGAGKFLMPGIAEMHGHLPGDDAPPVIGEQWMQLFVAGGVTTVRGVLGAPNQLAMRERIRKGELLGPQLIVYGPPLGGDAAKTPAEGVEKVAAFKQAGYDGIKIQEGLSVDSYQAIAREARRLRFPFGGHVPNDVGLERALAAGQRSIEHLDGYLEALAPPGSPPAAEPGKSPFINGRSPALDHLDEARIPALVAATRKAGAMVVPTMSLWKTLMGEAQLAALQKRPELIYFAPRVVDDWIRAQREAEKDPPPADRVRKLVGLRDRVLAALAAEPDLVMLGSDSPQRFSVPGFSLQHEVKAMLAAGMTPAQIVYAATIAPARYLGRQKDFGTIEVGKRADLILAEASPLDDPGNMFRTAGVMVNGRWLPRRELDGLLVGIENALRYPPAAEIKDLPIPASEADALAGRYTFEKIDVTVARKDGKLTLTAHDPKGDRTERLRSQGGGVYLIPEVKATVRFEMKGGRAAALLGSQGGAQFRAARVEK
jgi:imidazolonepropionase-like amidohydrolase